MITVILQNNKEWNFEVDDEDRAVASDFLVVAGESGVTEFNVVYPEKFKAWAKRVDFINSRRESWTEEFEGFNKPNENHVEFNFALPSEVTVTGELYIIFKAFNDNREFIWQRIALRVWDNGQAGKTAVGNPDLVDQAYILARDANEKATAAVQTSQRAETASSAALETINKLTQPIDCTEINAEGNAQLLIKEDGGLKAVALKGGTPQLKAGMTETLPPGSSNEVILDNSDPLHPVYNFRLAAGQQGMPGSGVAAGMGSVEVYEQDWQEDAEHGYRLVITADKHKIGDTNALIVEANPRAGTDISPAYDDMVKAADGTVTLYSRIKWTGVVLIAGGACEGRDVEARREISAHKADTTAHVSATERENWNSRETPAAAQIKADDALKAAKTYTDSKVAALAGAAPEILDTLQELATAVGDNPNHATEMLEIVGKKAEKTELATHVENRSNPHEITAKQVGAIPNNMETDWRDGGNGRLVAGFSHGVGTTSELKANSMWTVSDDGRCISYTVDGTFYGIKGQKEVAYQDYTGNGKLYDNGERVYSPNNPPPIMSSAPYKYTIESWSGTAGDYVYTVQASVHGKGADPIVEMFDANGNRMYDDYALDSNGNITFRSTVATSLIIKIRS